MQTQFSSFYQFATKVLARAEYRLRRRWRETTGQDLVEYALMAGFVAVSCGAILPPVATSISTIFSKITCLLTETNSQRR